ncbi:MAG: restriction endonuclease subunit S [Nanoarchaeota archaeon]|nr:restriction endonuclease subunit S [Nanoarchaeota archaeon]MBU1622377.1 restriction endonuclease subunit S [Nanoarchaeota archaeon]MBU1974381.1 restriction endonuclease subunit S [Nanoarchaeota archaeon]
MKLPKGWKEVELKDIGQIVTGSTPPRVNPEYYGNSIPWIKPPDLNHGMYVSNSKEKISEKGRSKVRILPKGSIIVSCIGIIGKVAIAGCELCTNQQINSIIPNEEIADSRFIYYLIKKIKPILEKRASSAVVPLLNKSEFSKFKINLPPLETQKEIVAILEKAEKTKEWRKEADELTKDFLRGVFLEMFGNPVKNSKKWTLFKLDAVGTLARGKSKHRPRNEPKLLGGRHPLIQTGEVASSKGYIRNYTQSYSDLGLAQSRMWPKGTLCITIAANIALTGILTFDACFPDSIVGFAPNDKVNTEYVQWWMSFLQKTLEESAPESAQKNINLKILSELNIPVPPIELQNRFASIVKEVESMKEQQKHSKNHIDKLFNALMQKTFKGELLI